MDIVILAAGLGNRFFANNSKVNVNFWGISVLKMLCLNAQKTFSNVFAVVKEGGMGDLPSDVVSVIQKPLYGTGAAAQSYFETVGEARDVLFIPGDAPLVDYDVINRFISHSKDADIVLGIMQMPKGPEYYGRIFLKNDCVFKIVEWKHHKQKTQYANTGVIFISKKVVPLLNFLQVGELGEIYLTEIVEIAIQHGFSVKPIILQHDEALGFNTLSEFHTVLGIAQKKWRLRALNSSAIFFDINKVYLSYDTQFLLGAVIEPYVRFLPGVRVGGNAIIKAFSSLENCFVDGVVGPFAHVRSGEIKTHAEVGAFVEVNRSSIGHHSKAKHLAYLGDVEIRENVNIGAGCVVCNYDGHTKHKSIIHDNAFIGANTTLIAPLSVGSNALLAAGSSFNQDVGDGQLAIARPYQINKERKSLKNLKKIEDPLE